MAYAYVLGLVATDMAARNDEIPKQVRGRTDPEAGLAYRYDVIQEAADRFECNKTDAIVKVCDVAGPIVDGIQGALAHPDLPPSLAEVLAETISSQHVKVEYRGPEIEMEID